MGKRAPQQLTCLFVNVAFANGSVIFGGIDRSKFRGELEQVPIVLADDGQVRDFFVSMTSLHLAMGGKQGNGGQNSGMVQDGEERQRQRRSTKPKRSKVNGMYGSCRSSQSDGGNGRDKRGPNYCKGNCRDKELRNNLCNGTRNENKNNTSNRDMIDLGLQQNEDLTLIDTGGVDIVIPRTAIIKVAEALSTTFSDKDGLGLVDCETISDAQNTLVLGFNQNKTMVSIPLDRMRLSNDLMTEDDAKTVCAN